MPIVVPPHPAAPPPVLDATSLDGIVRAVVDTAWAGVLVKADFSGVVVDPAWMTPFQARVYRQDEVTGEVPVRSGDTTMSYDRIVYAYDHETPLGRAATYRAVPILADGSESTTSAGASVFLPAPLGGFDDPGEWCKSLEDPALSMQIKIEAWPDGTYPGQVTADRVLGSSYPAATWGRRLSLTSSMTVRVYGYEEYQRFLALLDAGPVLFQGKPGRLRPDVYALIGDASYKRPTASPDSPWLTWSFPITAIERPPTTGQVLRVPGKSFADRERDFPLFSDIALSGRLFRDGMGM